MGMGEQRHSVRVEADVTGYGKLFVDGNDLSASIEAAQIILDPKGEGSVVVLRLGHHAVNAELNAFVRVSDDGTSDRDVIANFLAGLDLQQLEQAALQGTIGGQSPAQATLAAIRAQL